jgi:hypothetical protein
MKNAILGIFVISILSLSSPAFADGGWHKVLSCDGGAVHIDNMFQETRLFQGMTAQVVIDDPNIVRYFVTTGAIPNNPPNELLIRAFGYNGNLDQNQKVLSFKTEEGGTVTYNESESTLFVSLGSYRHGANWYFHNCINQ